VVRVALEKAHAATAMKPLGVRAAPVSFGLRFSPDLWGLDTIVFLLHSWLGWFSNWLGWFSFGFNLANHSLLNNYWFRLFSPVVASGE